MPSLHDVASAVRQKYQNDADAIELEQMSKEICTTARNMLDAIDTATHEQNIYLSMVASLSDRGEDDEPLEDEQIQSAEDAAASQGDIADIAARQAEAFGRELATKILRSSDL